VWRGRARGGGCADADDCEGGPAGERGRGDRRHGLAQSRAPDNGIKLWAASGKAFDSDQRDAIATRVDAGDYDLRPWDGHGSLESLEDSTDQHATAITESVSIDDPPSVAVDIGNGTGG